MSSSAIYFATVSKKIIIPQKIFLQNLKKIFCFFSLGFPILQENRFRLDLFIASMSHFYEGKCKYF